MELSLGELYLGVFTFVLLFYVFGYVFGFMCRHLLCFMDIYFYVWYVSDFEVGMNLCACMDIFLLWYLFSLSLHMCGACGIYALFIVSFIIHPFATLLEVGGNLDGWRVTVCAYTLTTQYPYYA